MLPGLSHSPQHNVFTHHVKTTVNNLSFGRAADGGVSTYISEPSKAIDLYIEILAGVTIGAASRPYGSTLLPALFFRLPTGSRVYIKNNGTIWGGGGRGGQGDRGRNNGTASPFVGGGGGGGAGTNSVGGSKASADPDGDAIATDGSGATPGSTTGGAAGTQDPDEAPGVSDGGYVAGSAPQKGGDAIRFSNAGGTISIYIDNSSGLIYAGADGGLGGFQFGPLSGGNTTAPEAGKNTPTSLTTVSGSSASDACVIAYPSSYSLTWIGGNTYPSLRGIINDF